MNRTALLAAIMLASAGASAQRHTRTPRHGPVSASGPSTAAPADLEPPTTPNPETDALIEVIQGAAVAGTPEGARSISTLLLRGVTPRAAAAGLDALGVLGRAEGAPAVLRFLSHRRPTLRRHAIAAAQAIHTPELVSALVGRLGDSEESVRIDAAAALGEVGHGDATAALFEAFERDLVADGSTGRLLHESAKAIARIGGADDVTRLLSYLRRAPFRSMADSMRAALARRDLPEAMKVHVVQTVGDLATHEVREFLTSIVADAHGQDTPVSRAAHAAAERIAE